jgi:sulfur-oxidizing protein SoxX
MATSLIDVMRRALPSVLLGGVLMTGSLGAWAETDAEVLAEGKKIAFDRKKGNCLACHLVDDGVSPGNLGPPLVAMKARFPQREVLRAQIWDAQEKNPETIMPPFGRHGMLSEAELDKVVDYVWSL